MCVSHPAAPDMSMPLFPGQSLEIHNRPHCARSDRGDRDRLLSGKRDAWSLGRAPAAPSYHRASGLSANGSSVGPPSKRRPPGRHTVYVENGRHGGSSRADASSAFGGVALVENGSGRKLDRDACYPLSTSSVLGTSTGYNASALPDHRLKDVDERTNREVHVQSGDARDPTSAVPVDQLARPHRSQVFPECNNAWDRDGRPRSSNVSGWDVTRRVDRETRDRLRGKSDTYRRSGFFSHSDPESWHGTGVDLDTGPDRCSGSTRDTVSSDLNDNDQISIAHEWKLRDRPATSSASMWSSAISGRSGMSKDSCLKPPDLQNAALPTTSPQQSPFSSPTVVSSDGGRDDVGLSSPRKRPRLGWGQGLAKYEKKKVIDSDDGLGALLSLEGVPPDSFHGPCIKELSAVAELPCAKPTQNVGPAFFATVDGSSEVFCDGTAPVPVDHNVSSERLEAQELVCCVVKASEVPLEVADEVKLSAGRLVIGTHPPAESRKMHSGSGVISLSGQHTEGAPQETSRCSSEGAANAERHRLEAEADVLDDDGLAVSGNIGDEARKMRNGTSVCSGQGGAGCETVSWSCAFGAQDLSSSVVAPLCAYTGECQSATELKEMVAVASPGLQILVGSEEFDIRGDHIMEHGKPCCAPAECRRSNVPSHIDRVLTSQSLSVDEDGQEGIASSVCAEEEPHAEPAFFKPPLGKEEDPEDHDGSIGALLLENRQAAIQASKSLSHLLPKWPDSGSETLYRCPVEASVWQMNASTHDRIKQQLRERLLERKRRGMFKERALAFRYRALKEVWCREQLSFCQRDRSKVIRRVEFDRRNVTAPWQRTSSRLRSTPSGAARPDALAEGVLVVKKLLSESFEPRSVERMPAMVLDEKEKFFQRFVTKNGLIEDPLSVERERRHVNPWTDAEKKVFLEKYALFCKNFRKIALFLEHKTTADCVEFYYRNQKSEDFEKIHRRQQLKKRRDYSRSSASYLATTVPAGISYREINAVRVEALTMAVASASAGGLVSAGGGRESVKPARTGLHKSADRGKNMGLDMVAHEGAAGFRPIMAKEGKATTSLLAVAASTPGFATNSCSLSSAASLPKNYGDRHHTKGGSFTRTVSVDHSSVCKGSRNMQVKRETLKALADESEWTSHEKQLFKDAVAIVGKDFKIIALQVGTKTPAQCEAFFIKARKRLGLDQLVDQVESNMAVLEITAAGEQTCTVVGNDKASSFTRDVSDAVVTEAQAMDIDTGGVEGLPGGSNGCAEKTLDDTTTGHECLVVADDTYAPTPAGCALAPRAHREDCGLVDSITGRRKETGTCASDSFTVLASDSCFEAEQQPVATHPSSQGGDVEVKDEPFRDEGKICESAGMPEHPMWTERVSKDAVDKSTMSLHSERSSAANLESKRCQVLVKVDPESPSTGISSINEPACVQRGNLESVQSADTLMAVPPLVHIVKEKVAKTSMGGEAKPRREPTSWTQEEKEKFAEIIRMHGKDWTLLHESIPAKSLTQIKTYFQNSKAKLGFAPLDGSASGSRCGGSRKRKADDSDTSSNAGSSGVVSQQKGPGLTDELKVSPGSASVASAENLAFALCGRSGGQTPEDSVVSNLQRLLRQMCTPNAYASQAGLFQLPVAYHSVFAPPPQRASMQQQQITISPALGLQQPAVSQQAQTLQSILHAQLQQPQPQPVTVRKHQMQQQQQASQMITQQVVAQLQQQASQSAHLRQHSAMQQMQLTKSQQALHGQVQVQSSVQSPTTSLSKSLQLQQQKQMVVGQTACTNLGTTHLHNLTQNAEYLNRLLYLQSLIAQGLPLSSRHHLQATPDQQDQTANLVNSLQLQQQLQHIRLPQKQIQAVQQPQQQQSGVQAPLHHLEQHQVDHQQMLQQLHPGELSLLREVMQASVSHNFSECSGDMAVRSTGPLRQPSRVGDVHNVGQVCSSSGPEVGKGQDQMKMVGGASSDGLRAGDVKLFGQSLLSQPSAASGLQPPVSLKGPRPSSCPSERPTVLLSPPSNTTSGLSVANTQQGLNLARATCFKDSGHVSLFGRAGVSVENCQYNWPAVLAGNLGMWSGMLSSVQVAGAQGSGDLETQLPQEAAMRTTDQFSREINPLWDTHSK